MNLYDQSAKADLNVGANRVDDALPDRLRRAQVERLSGRLDAWLNPPAVEPVAVETAAPIASGASSSTVMCESGGDYGVYDSSGTYWGGWQFDQQTWNAYAPSGEWGSATPAEQDAAAANVPYDAWPNC